jgi:hypothetical protein
LNQSKTVMDKTPAKPATAAEAEELAKKAVGDYLTACRMASVDRVAMGNYLMKLASVTGVMMANAEGSETAFDRLLGTAQFVLNTMPKDPAPLRTMQ